MSRPRRDVNIFQQIKSRNVDVHHLLDIPRLAPVATTARDWAEHVGQLSLAWSEMAGSLKNS